MHCGMLQHGKGNFCTSSRTLLIWPIQSGSRVQSTLNIYEIYWNIMKYIMKHENHLPGAIRDSWRSGAVFRLARVSLMHVVSSQRFVQIRLIESHLIDEWQLTDSSQPAWSGFHALRVLPDPASWCNVDFGFVCVAFGGLCESLKVCWISWWGRLRELFSWMSFWRGMFAACFIGGCLSSEQCHCDSSIASSGLCFQFIGSWNVSHACFHWDCCEANAFSEGKGLVGTGGLVSVCEHVGSMGANVHGTGQRVQDRNHPPATSHTLHFRDWESRACSSEWKRWEQIILAWKMDMELANHVGILLMISMASNLGG